MHISSLFLVSNDKAIHKGTEKASSNFSIYNLTESDKSSLMKGLDLAIRPKKIEYSKFLLPFELLYCDKKSNSQPSVDADSKNACLQNKGFTCYSAFDRDTSSSTNLSEAEFESSWKLKNENNLVIQKANKGNTIGILDKHSYLKSAEEPLSESINFKNIPVAPDKDLSFIINSGKKSNWSLKKHEK